MTAEIKRTTHEELKISKGRFFIERDRYSCRIVENDAHIGRVPPQINSLNDAIDLLAVVVEFVKIMRKERGMEELTKEGGEE